MPDQTPPTPYRPSGSHEPDPRPAPARHELGQDAEQSVSEKAGEAAQASTRAAADVAQTAADAAQDVAEQTASQARQLASKTGQELTEQAGVHKDAVAQELNSLADQLAAMTEHVDQDGFAVELAARARDRAREAARWLQDREPADLLDELRGLGRARPGAYLAGAVAAGVLAGRLTRGAVAAHTEPDAGDASGTDGKGSVAPEAAVGEHSRDVAPASSQLAAGSRHGLPDSGIQGGLYSDTAISSRPTPRSTP